LGGESVAEEVTSGRRKKKINAEDHRGTEGAEKRRTGGKVGFFSFFLFPFFLFYFQL
jgi:hypothetical protein